MVNRRPIEIAGKFTTPPLLALAGGGFCWRPLTPRPSPGGRGGLPFYIDEQDGQDWGGDGIATSLRLSQ